MDVYAAVTDSIVRAIEANPGEAMMPWDRSGAGSIPSNALTLAEYNGVNILNLWCEAQAKGYKSAEWATYKQWQQMGAQVRKGEKSSIIVFYKEIKKENEEGEEEKFRVLRWYSVFNADQVDGYEPPKVEGLPIDRIGYADEYVKDIGARVECGGAQAFYRPSTDTIHMPDEERFFDTKTSTRTEAYYSVLFHELTHWSGAKHRLDRIRAKKFGDPQYALEELVAELGAAFLCAKLHITKEPRLDHAQYINNWLQALKNEKKFIFTAAARAQEAVDYLWLKAAANKALSAPE